MTFEQFITDCDPLFSWAEKGPLALLDKPRNKNRDTALHLVCRRKTRQCVEFAKLLLDPYSPLMRQLGLEPEKFREFVGAPNAHGESALFLCLKDATKDDSIVKLFLDNDTIASPNAFINCRVGHKTTLLHQLVDNEMFDLAKHFIDLYEYGDWEIDSLDFSIRDARGRTTLEAALESGHVKFCKLLFNKCKLLLIVEEAQEKKNFITFMESTPQRRFSFENKLVFAKPHVPVPDEPRFPNELVRELDCRSFERLWLEYIVLAKEYAVPISVRDEELFMIDDAHKHIFMNRVSDAMSKKHPLISLVLLKFNQCFVQFAEFVRRLPYNFRLLVRSPTVERVELDFRVKTLLYEAPLTMLIDKEMESTDNRDNELESRLARAEFTPIRVYKTADDLRSARDLFLEALTIKDVSFHKTFYQKLGDAYTHLAKNPAMAFTCYDTVYDQVNAAEDVFEKLDFLARAITALVSAGTVHPLTDAVQKKYFSRVEHRAPADRREASVLVRYYDALDTIRVYPGLLDLALQIADSLGDEHEDVARLSTRLFITEYKPGDGFEQIARLHRAEEQYRLSNASLDKLATTNYNLGWAYEELGDHDVALDHYTQAIRGYKEFYGNTSHLDIASTYTNLSVLHEQRGEYAEAVAFNQQALEMYESIYKREHTDIATVLNNLGTCYDKNHKNLKLAALMRVDSVLDAADMYERLLNAATRSSEIVDLKKNCAMTFYNLGLVHMDMDRIDACEDYFRRALAIYAELGDLEEQANTLQRLLQCNGKNSEYHGEFVRISMLINGPRILKNLN